MRTAKTLGAVGALIAATLVGGTLISSVAAEPPSASPATSDVSQYCQSFRSHLADALHTDAAGLESAFRAAAETTVGEALKNGDLSQERADAIKQRLENANIDHCLGMGRRLVGQGHPAVRLDLGTAAAGALGMQPSELVQALRAGKSLQEIARQQGVEYAVVSKAVLDSARSLFDQAVALGRLTADREQAMLDRLEKALSAGTWPRRVPALPGRGPATPAPAS